MLKDLKNHIKIDKLNFSEPININNNLESERIGRTTNSFIPNQTGVYIYQNARMEVMYIGKATSLRKRYNDHKSDDLSKVYSARKASNNNIKYYSYALCDSVQQAEMMEMIYTYLYKPKLNNFTRRQIIESGVI